MNDSNPVPIPISGASALGSLSEGVLGSLRAKPASGAPSAGQDLERLARDLLALAPDSAHTLLAALRSALAGDLTETERYQAAERLAAAVYPKFKFSEFGRIFLEDESFLAFYQRFMDPGNWHSLDRKFVVREFLKLVAHLEGEIAECGTYKGFSAYLMCQALQGTPARVHLFDSFEGLSEVDPEDGSYWTRGALSVSEEAVHETLRRFENYRVYKGWIPDRFADVADLRFRFVHIDVDLYQPTRDSLAFFYPRLVPGGIALFDDHGFTSCPGARQAIEGFMEACPEPVALLPTGQAFMIKQ